MLSQFLGGVMLLYLGVALLFLAAGLWASASLNRWARLVLGAGLAAHTGVLLGRWWESYHLALGTYAPDAFLGKTAPGDPAGAHVQFL